MLSTIAPPSMFTADHGLRREDHPPQAMQTHIFLASNDPLLCQRASKKPTSRSTVMQALGVRPQQNHPALPGESRCASRNSRLSARVPGFGPAPARSRRSLTRIRAKNSWMATLP